MTSEHIRQMRELRAEKNKLEAERDHWMNEAIELRRRKITSMLADWNALRAAVANGDVEATQSRV